jgi:hypothetical protein
MGARMQSRKYALFSTLVVALLALMACTSIMEYAQTPKSACVQTAYHRKNIPPWLVVNNDFSNAPEQTRNLIKDKVEKAFVVAVEHSKDVHSFMGYVLPKRWKEQYSLANKAKMTPSEKSDIEAIADKETSINEWLYAVIKEDAHLYDANVVYNNWIVTSERFFESEEKHQEWLARRIGDQAKSLMDYNYGETLRSAPDGKRVDIRLSGDLLSITVPVFYEGKYVCDLWFNYCIKDFSESSSGS